MDHGASDMDIRISLSAHTVDRADLRSRLQGMLQGEATTAEAAIDNLKARARTQATKIVEPLFEGILGVHRSHPGAFVWADFSLSAVRLAAGPLANGSSGWVAYGTLVLEHNEPACERCPIPPRPYIDDTY